MRFVFLIGGFVGFALVALAGFAAGRSAAFVVRDAAIGCLVGALLFRWFWSVVVKAIADTRARRLKEAAASEPAADTKSAPSPVPAPIAARSR